MSAPYPTSFRDISAWALTNEVTVEEARQRFAQFVILCAIASVRSLRDHLVFKGGNALDFAMQPNRSTIDLDFTLDMSSGGTLASVESLRTAIESGLRRVASRFGMGLAVNSVHQNPPGTDRTFVTFEVRIGYALPDAHSLLLRMANNQLSPQVIPIEVSINEPIHGSGLFSIHDAFDALRICTIEDIVGEKLRSLLQQPIRNRNRRQDMLDIAVIVQLSPHLDRSKVAAALLIKAQARNVAVSRSAFRDPEVMSRAQVGYESLEATTRVVFIPFDEAVAIVQGFVDELPIPAR